MVAAEPEAETEAVPPPGGAGGAGGVEKRRLSKAERKRLAKGLPARAEAEADGLKPLLGSDADLGGGGGGGGRDEAFSFEGGAFRDKQHYIG